MSKKKNLKKEQRFPYRKASLCLASVLVANATFGELIAKNPVLHAETTTVGTAGADTPTNNLKKTEMENGSKNVGTWTEAETVLNKQVAAELATISDIKVKFPDGYEGDPTEGRSTFMIQLLSSSEDTGVAPRTNSGSFNLRRGRELYLVLSVNSVQNDHKIYVNLFDKNTGTVALDEQNNPIQEEIAVPIGVKTPFPGLNAYAKKDPNTVKFDYSLLVIEDVIVGSDGESSAVRNIQLRTGMTGNAKNTLVYHSQTLSGAEYNQYSGLAPVYNATQDTGYYVKETSRRSEEFLAKYSQSAALSGTSTFHIAGEAEFDNYELIDTPDEEEGVMTTRYPLNSPLVRWYASPSMQAKVQYVTKPDGTSRYLHFLINPEHPEFLETYKEYRNMTELEFQNHLEKAFRLTERFNIVNETLAEYDKVRSDESLGDPQKEEKIAEIRAKAMEKLNNKDTDKFFLIFTSEEIAPLSYNSKPDAITGKEEWEFTSEKYNFRRRFKSKGKYDKTNSFKMVLAPITGGGNKGNFVLDDSTSSMVVEHIAGGEPRVEGKDVKIFGTNMAMLSPFSRSDNYQKYYYAEKGGLKVFYVDDKGKEIQSPVLVHEHANSETPYNTDIDLVKDKKIKEDKIKSKESEIYFYNRIDKIEDGMVAPLKPTSLNTNDEKREIVKITEESGEIETDTLKELTYVYEKGGKVKVNYVDKNGNVIKNPVNIEATEGVDGYNEVEKTYLKPGTEYDASVKKDEVIKADNGKVYRLVPAGDYKVGTVTDDNYLTVSNMDTVTGLDIPNGTVESDKTKEITYVYEEVESAVVVEYHNTEGKVIKTPVMDLENAKQGDSYDTEVDNRPDTITDADGTVYVYKEVRNDSDPTKGTVTKADGITTVKYVYEKAGKVNVNYVDEFGNVIKKPETTYHKQGETYNTKDKKDNIITANGKKYVLVPEGAYDVGKVSTDGNLTEKGNNKATGIDSPSGTVDDVTTAKEITYVYKEVKSGVVVEYYNTKGEKIKDDVIVTNGAQEGDQYSTANQKDDNIKNEKDGKTYYFKEWDNTSAPEDGTVTDGVQIVKFIYEEAGKVNVNYVDTDGNKIKDPESIKVKNSDETNLKSGDSYTEDVKAKKEDTIIKDDGKVYRLAPASDDYAVGKVSENGNLTESKLDAVKGVDNPEGEVESGKTKEITFVYKEVKANVVVNYYDVNGNVIKAPVNDETNVSIGTEYDTAKDNKPEKIKGKYDNKVYYFKEVRNDSDKEIGKVTHKDNDADTVVNYVYELAGNVNVNYVDTDGNKIKEPVMEVENGKPGNDYIINANNKPTTISSGGKLYKLVAKGKYPVGTVTENNNLNAVGDGKDGLGIDDTTGKITSGTTKEITFVYEEVKSDVIVEYYDTDGTPLGKTVVDENSVSVGTEYNTDEDNRPEKITDEKGIVYYYKELKEGSAQPNGTVGENKITVKYVYEKAGKVNVNYVDIDGNVIKDPESIKKDNDSNLKPSENYDALAYKKDTITTDDGKVYKLAPAGDDYAVGKVSENGNLTESKLDAVKGVDNPEGEVESGKTKEITFVYKEVKANVVVNYYDVNGKEIQDPVNDEENVSIGTEYDTIDKKEKTITTKDGKVYYFKEVRNDSDEEKGKVEKSDSNTVVNYVYELAGNVVIKYVTEDGVEIKDSVNDEKDAKPGKKYDTIDNKVKTITTNDGKVYELVPTATRGEETGNVKSGETIEVTYVYRLKSDIVPPISIVVTNYVDESGNKISDTELGTKPNKSIPGYEFTGKTTTDEFGNTTHIYRKTSTGTVPNVKVVTNHVDENGNVISPQENGKQPNKTIPGYEFTGKTTTDENGNTTHIYRKVTSPSTNNSVKPKPLTLVTENDKKLPKTGVASSSIGVIGTALVGAVLALVGKNRRKDD